MTEKHFDKCTDKYTDKCADKHTNKYWIKTKEIYFIRHGQTDWNNLNKPQGCEHDISLNANGKIQAMNTGKYLAKYRLNSTPFDLIISSGLTRANQTAQLIADQIAYNKKILIMSKLKEKCHGKLGGMTKTDKKQLAHIDPHMKKLLHMYKLIKHNPDPINQIESYNVINRMEHKYFGTELQIDFEKRIKQSIRNIYERPEKKIIIISHGTTIQNILRILTNIEDYIIGEFPNGSNCHISFIKVYKRYLLSNKIKYRTKIVKLLNTLHLSQ